ncbi:MAG: sterol desaturase family protein [Deltaproteobacteria bacterium]|nr:sterol desaturase family protein [Nannocystaceae bacterium]
MVCGVGVLATAALGAWLPLSISDEVASASVLGWVAARGGLLGLVVFQIVTALGLGALLSGLSFAIFFVRGRERWNPGYRFDRKAIIGACTWAALGITGGTLLAAPMQLAVLGGWSRAYFRVEDHGWGYLLLSMVLLLVFTETLVYWTHRALHHPWLYRRTHVYHHQFHEPTPWAAFSFHPFDAFAQAFPYHVAAFIFPLHIGVYTIGMALVMLWSVSIHDRVSLLPYRWLLYAGHHSLHHLHNRYNLGQYFTIWDRIGGTYRCPSTLPEAYRAGRPEPGDRGES